MRVPVIGEDSVFLNEFKRSLSVVPVALNYHTGLKLRTWISDISYRSGETHLGTYNDVLFGTDQARTAGLHLRRGNHVYAHDVFTGPRDRNYRDPGDTRFYDLDPRDRAYNRSRTSVTIDRGDGSRIRLSLDDSFGIVQRPWHWLCNHEFGLALGKPPDQWESLYFRFDENRLRMHLLFDGRGSL